MLKLLIFIFIIIIILQNINNQKVEKFSVSLLKIINIKFYSCTNSSCNNNNTDTLYNELISQSPNNKIDIPIEKGVNPTNTIVYESYIELVTNFKTVGNTTVLYKGGNNVNSFYSFLKDHRILYTSPIVLELRTNSTAEMLNIIIPEFVNNIKKHDRKVEIKRLNYDPNLINQSFIKIIFPLNNNGELIYVTNDPIIFKNDIYMLSNIVENFISSIP
jgi:hypothetical protein